MTRKTDNQLSSAFVSVASDLHHEIRSPINTIISMTGLAKRKNPDPELKNCLDTIEGAASRLLTLLDDIIEFSDSSLNGPPEYVDFTITDLLEELKESFHSGVTSGDVKYKLNIKRDLPEWYKGPVRQLRQVLLQVIKYTTKHLLSKHVDLKICMSQEKYLEVEVSTKGPDASNIDFLQSWRLDLCDSVLSKIGGRFEISDEDSVIYIKILIPVEIKDRRPSKIHGLFDEIILLGSDQFSLEIIKRRLMAWGLEVTKEVLSSKCVPDLKNGNKVKGKRLLFIDWNAFKIHKVHFERQLSSSENMINLVVYDVPPIEMIALGNISEETGLLKFETVMWPSKGEKILEAIMKFSQVSLSSVTDSKEVNEQHENFTDLIKGKKILIVEDERISRKILIEILKEIGAKPVCASSGKAAILAVSKYCFHAVLMDIRLPDMNGYEVAREIRARDEYKDIPIIGISAGSKEQENFQLAEMDDFLTKPFDREKLVNSLVRLLGHKR